MKNVFREAMNEAFDLTQMLARIDYHHVRGNLSDADREELVVLAREKANPSAGVDVMAKLQDLETRVKALEEGKKESAGTDSAVEPYKAGTWYFTGNKVLFGGQIHRCTAPEGQVCTWSPAEFPAWWEVVQ